MEHRLEDALDMFSFTVGARCAELVERALGVAVVDVDPADPAAVDRHAEALAQGVQRRVPNAVVGREPDDGHLVDVVASRRTSARSVSSKPE